MKPREWWLIEMEGDLIAFDEKSVFANTQFNVIEKSAYEELQERNAELEKELRDHQPFDAYYKEWEVERGTLYEELEKLRLKCKK